MSVPTPGPIRVSRRHLLLGGGGLAAAGLLPAASLALAGGTYQLPVNLSGLVPGSTGQVVLAVADRYRSPKATLSTWARQVDGSWRMTHGPYLSWIGVGGFAAPGRKREGDGHSPTGVFGIPLAFGTRARPAGLKLPWHALHPPYEVWVENPRSRYYNELVDIRRVGSRAIGDNESAVTYPLGAFVAYNSRRVPWLGSAIFMHPSHNSPTIGCVSIPLANLTTVLQWLTPQANPRIVMGVTAELTTMGGPIQVLTPSGTPTASTSPTDAPTPTAQPTTAQPTTAQPTTAQPTTTPTDTPTPSDTPTPTGTPTLPIQTPTTLTPTTSPSMTASTLSLP